MKKMATILLVEAIEPGLKFWTDVVGFDLTHRIDHDGKLGFVMLNKGDIEVHLQTRAITAKDAPHLAGFKFPPACVLYFDVEDLDSLLRKLDGLEVVIPKKKTFYGTTEIYVREPCGHIVGFAQVG